MRVHSRAELEVAGEPRQQSDQDPPFIAIEIGTDVVVERRNELVDPRNQRRAPSGQTDIEGPPVLLVPMSPDPASGLHLIDQPDHVVAMNPKRIRQLLLRLSLRSGQVAQDAVGPG